MKNNSFLNVALFHFIVLCSISFLATAGEIKTLVSIIPDFQVNEDDEGSAKQASPCIATDGNGNFVISWEDYRNGDPDIYAQRYLINGDLMGTNIKVNDNEDSTSQLSPTIAIDKSGNFVIAWDNIFACFVCGRDIRMQHYFSDGTANGTNFNIQNDWLAFSPQIAPTIGMTWNGKFIVAWEQPFKNRGIYAQRYQSDCSAIGNNIMVHADEEGIYPKFSAIAVDKNENFVITWKEGDYSDSDIYAQRFLNNDTPAGNNFKVNDDEGSAYQTSPCIAINNDGNFVIAWEDHRNDNSDIYAQQFLSDGTTVNSNFKVNDDTVNAYQSSPSTAFDGNGNFVITWCDTRNGDSDIFSQRYLSDNSKLGNNFRVTNTSKNVQCYPDVKLWNMRIYNTWVDNRAEGTGYDIWANVLDWENPSQIPDSESSKLPSSLVLHQNYPNPFNKSTKISYSIPISNFVKLAIYDLLGREIQIIVNELQEAGNYYHIFNASNLSSGIYFYRLQLGSEFIETKKMLLAR